MKSEDSKSGRAKGAGSLYRRGGVWYAQWMVDGRLYKRTTGTGDRNAAERVLAAFVAPFRMQAGARRDAASAASAASAGLPVAAAALRAEAKQLRAAAARETALPLSEAWRAFDESLYHREWAAGTRRVNEARVCAFLDWMRRRHPEARTVRDVSGAHAEEFLRDVRGRLSGKTFNEYRAILSQAWNGLRRIASSGVESNPWTDIERVERRSHTRRELTVEELGRVVGATDGEMRTLFAIGIYTGLRLGDAVHLEWGAVDLARGFVSLVPGKTARHGTRVRIPLSPVLRRVLEETPAARRRGRVVPGLAALYDEQQGGMLLVRRVQAVFRAAGIETQAATSRRNKDGSPRMAVEVGFHSLRHTYVSLCANAGVPLAIVQAIVGHTSVAMTEHYFHAEDAALRGAAAALPDVTAPGGDVASPPAGVDALAAFRAAVAALRPEQLKEAARILREAGVLTRRRRLG